MMGVLSLSAIAEKLQGNLIGNDVTFSGVSTDTRAIEPGDVFIALKGDQFDGHKFVEVAEAQGAVAAIVDRPVDDVELPQLQVKDTTAALGLLGSLNRELFLGKLVALTGSCGKTTVKEMLASILRQQGQVTATQGNLNNHIGAPLTLLSVDQKTQYAVIEMGASGMGEIDYLAGLACPDVSLVNNVAAAHLEGFGSEEGVAEEKSKIYRHIRSQGTAVVNIDEPYSATWLAWLHQKRRDIKVKTFSLLDQTAHCYAQNLVLTESGGYRFVLCLDGLKAEVILPVLGRANVNNALAAASCAAAVGASLDSIVLGLEKLKIVNRRMQPHVVSENLLAIDDSYNANPASVKAAADVLSDFTCQGKRTVLILGNLAELGLEREQALSSLGRDLQLKGLPELYTATAEIKSVFDAFNSTKTDAQSCRHFDDKAELIESLKSEDWKNTVVLIKGSRSAQMEDVVQAMTTREEQ